MTCKQRLEVYLLQTVLLTWSSGVANGLASTFRLMGGAVATAIYSAILANHFAAKLPAKMAPVIRDYNVPAPVIPELLQAAALNTADAYEALPSSITPKFSLQLRWLSSTLTLTHSGWYTLSQSPLAFLPLRLQRLQRQSENEARGPKAAEVEGV